MERKKEWKAEGRRGFEEKTGAGAGQKGIAERRARFEGRGGREGGREGGKVKFYFHVTMCRSLYLNFVGVCEWRGGEGGEERRRGRRGEGRREEISTKRKRER